MRIHAPRLLGHLVKAWLVVTFCVQGLSAQLFPVTTTIAPGGMALPPYLHQWINPGALRSPIQITIQFNDLNNEPIVAGLRTTIFGQGVSLTTNPGTPVLMDLVPGQLMILDATILEQLFSTGRLSGAQSLGSQHPLPEGIYTICLEVYDLRRDAVISNRACGVFTVQNFDVPEWLMLQPSAELPSQKFSLGRVDANISNVLTFSWSPRHPPVLMADYTFEIFEYPGDGGAEYSVPPDQLVYGLLPYFSVTTSATSYVYTLTDPTLDRDKMYMARLTVADPMGIYQFVNQGVGPVATFQLFDADEGGGGPCMDPANRPQLTLGPWDTESAKLSWVLADGFPSEEIVLETFGALDEDWHMQETLDPTDASYSLSLPDQQIQRMRIGVRCTETGEFRYSNVVSFNSFPEVLPDNCELPIDSYIENQTPLEMTLFEGDSVMVGDFVLVMERLAGGGPPYSGEGYVVTPLFNLLRPRVATVFSHLEINSDFQVTSGRVETVFDSEDGLTIDLNGLSSIFRDMHAFDDLDYQMHDISDTIQQVYLNSEGQVEIITLDEDGNEIITTYPLTLEPVKDIGIGLHRDGYEHAGDIFLENTATAPSTFIGADGKIYGVIGSSLYEESDRLSQADPGKMGDKGMVTFRNHPKAAGGLDAPFSGSHLSDYERIAPDYQMVWKAIRHGTSDSVVVDISDANADSLFFETHSGYSLRYKVRGNEITLHIPSRAEGDVDGVYAIGRDIGEERDQTLGGLKIASYPLDVYTLNVIPINGAVDEIDLVALATDLNKIYNPAIVSWQIKVHPNQEVDFNEDEDPRLATGKGTTSQYNKELRNVVHALRDKLELEKSTKENPVLNIVVVPALDAESQGYMPLSRDWGFVEATSQSRSGNEVNPLSRLIAHELGHGAFALRHSWEVYPELGEGTSDNLMDYGSGIQLTKRQWDQIHDPGPVLGFMETSGGAEGLSDPIYFCIQGEELPTFTNRCFVDPNGQSILLPDEITQVAFYAKEDSDPELLGKLASFRTGGIAYSVSLDEGAFKGYHNYKEQTDFYVASNTCESGELIVGSTEDCKYQIGTTEELHRVSICDCNYEKGESAALFDGMIPISGETLDDRLAGTDFARQEHFESDHISLLEGLSSQQYYYCHAPVSVDLDYFNSWMEDKLRILFEATGKEFKIVVNETSYPLAQQQLEAMARKVYERSNSERISALLYIHLFRDVLVDKEDVKTAEQTIYHPQYTLVDPNEIIEKKISSGKSFRAFLLDHYAYISKPYYQVVFKDLPGHESVSEVFINNDWTTGKEAIYSYTKWTYKQQEPVLTYMEAAVLKDKTEKVLLDEALSNLEDPKYFELEPIYNLKEECMFRYFEEYGDQADQGNFLTYFRSNIDDDCLYEQLDVFDAVVLPIIDVASFVPVLGAIPDLFGMSIAAYQGDALMLSMYSGGVLLHFSVGGALIEPGIRSGVRAAILSLGRKTLIDLEKASTRETADIILEYCKISDDQAMSFARRLSDDFDQVDHVCSADAYRYLEDQSAIGKFDEGLDVLFKGGKIFDEFTQILRTRLGAIDGIAGDKIDDLAVQIKTGLDGYHPDRLSDKALEAISKSKEGPGVLNAARQWNDPSKFDKFIGDLEVDHFADWVMVDIRRVEVWNLLPEGVRLNSQTLEEVSRLAAKTLNGNPLDIKKLIDNGFGDVLKSIEEATVVARLQKMNLWDPKLVDDLARRLGDAKYSGLADDLVDNDIFEVYDKLVIDPLNARDLVKHLDLQDGVLDKVGKSAFFTEVTSLGKTFESFVESNLATLRSKILDKYPYVDINEYEIFTQVQINTGVGSEYFVADMVLVKRTIDDFGQPILDKSKVVVVESKLSEATNLNTPQGNALAKVKSNSNTFDIRSVSKQNSSGFILSHTDKIRINDFIKAYSDGSANIINDVVSLK